MRKLWTSFELYADRSGVAWNGWFVGMWMLISVVTLVVR